MAHDAQAATPARRTHSPSGRGRGPCCGGFPLVAGLLGTDNRRSYRVSAHPVASYSEHYLVGSTSRIHPPPAPPRSLRSNEPLCERRVELSEVPPRAPHVK